MKVVGSHGSWEPIFQIGINLQVLSRVKLVSTLASGDADRSQFTVPQVAGCPVNFWLGNSEYFLVIFYQSMITWENCMK